MEFQTKILLVTLSILILTLVMNSVLSLASFEKVYVSSQVSTYELICKELKGKIERSLKFGKPLENFENMDKLLKDTLEGNPNITAIAICNTTGMVLYHTDPKGIGANISNLTTKMDTGIQTETFLMNDKYHSLVRILDRRGQSAGTIQLTFPRQIIIDKLKSMAHQNFNLLWLLMLLTSILLVILLAMIIMRPVKTQVLEMKKLLSREGGIEQSPYYHYLKEGVPDTMDEEIISGYLHMGRVRNEIDRLGVNLEAFSNSVTHSASKIDMLCGQQENFTRACTNFSNAHTGFLHQLSRDTWQMPPEDWRLLERLQVSLSHLPPLLGVLGQSTDLSIDLEIDPAYLKTPNTEG